MAKREHSYNSGRIHRAGDGDYQPPHSAPKRPARTNAAAANASKANASKAYAPAARSMPRKPVPAYAGGGAAARQRPRSRRRRWPWVVLAVVIVLAGLAGGLLWYLDNVIDPGDTGVIQDPGIVPKEYEGKDVYNFLIIGIDYTENREMTYNSDMIMYANFDVKNQKLNMLQIPRDSYVGELAAAGSEKKINGAIASGPDQENPINNLANIIETQFRLPVDNYISIDMDGLRQVVDVLGGVEVNIPREMYFDGSYLPAGTHTLMGGDVEFFVRNRSGEGFARGDPDRLANQRLFYAGLFKRLKNMSAGDLVALLPTIDEYINTDYSAAALLDVAQNLRAVPSESIMICMAPGATSIEGVWNSDPTRDVYDPSTVYQLDWYGRQIWQEDPENPEGGEMVTDPENPGIANLLNEYFRAHGSPVSADELGPRDESDAAYHRTIPENVALYPPNVQSMVAMAGDAPAAE